MFEWCVRVPYSSGSCRKPNPSSPIHEKLVESVPPGVSVGAAVAHDDELDAIAREQRHEVGEGPADDPGFIMRGDDD